MISIDAWQAEEAENVLLDSAYVNRLYYACFYAVSALLVTRGISTSRHGHLRSLLHRDFVKTRAFVDYIGGLTAEQIGEL